MYLVGNIIEIIPLTVSSYFADAKFAVDCVGYHLLSVSTRKAITAA